MSSVGDKLSDREASSRKRSRVLENDDNNNNKLDVDNDDNDDNDLKVTVGSIKEEEKKKKKKKSKKKDDDSPKGTTDEGDGDVEGQQMKEYRYQSKVLSFYSGYIRRLLSSPMKESTTKELTFPDIIPSTWELMIDLLTNPIRVRHMSPYDALDVLPFYDKYDFTKGIELCDDVLSDFIRQHIETQQQHEDILVDAISLAHKLKLDNSCIQGFMYIDRIVSGYPKFPMRWTVNHVKKLVPVLASNTLIQDSMRRRLHMKEEELDREFIESSAFPNYFVAQYQLIAARRTTGNIINKILVSNCGLGSGIYKESSDCTKKSVSCYTFMPADPELWEGNVRVHSYQIVKHEGQEWKIVAWVPNPGIPGLFISKHLCTCEGSRYSILPPNTGWEKTKSGRMPELNYYFCVDGKNAVEIAANL